MRYVLLGVAACFAYSVVVQLNDPDPLPWIAAYGSMVYLSLARFFGKKATKAFWMSVGVLGCLELISIPGFVSYLRAADHSAIFGAMSSDRPELESAREFLGIAISFAVLGGFALSGRRLP